MSSTTSQTTTTAIGVAAAAVATIGVLWYMSSSTTKAKRRKEAEEGKKTTTSNNNKSRSIGDGLKDNAPRTPVPTSTSREHDDDTPVVQNTSMKEREKVLHTQIEELDKKGKVLFKNKQFLDAAIAFTKALDIIDESQKDEMMKGSTSLLKQKITLMNNRSAMYEKGGMPELALEDCNVVLDLEVGHQKARTRKLRILESLKRWNDALVEVCAIQLLYMNANRINARMGLPLPPPPIPPSKTEEIVAEVAPNEVAKYVKLMNERTNKTLPSTYTLRQLLKSYTGYNAWMAKTAKDGSVESMTQPESLTSNDAPTIAKRAGLLLKRGRRHVYDHHFEMAAQDFEEAYRLVNDNDDVIAIMNDDDWPRILEWTGMVRHWYNDLPAALSCLSKCAELEPKNPQIPVKMAGVNMDSGNHDTALKHFDDAFRLDKKCADAHFHRANLYMARSEWKESRSDLEQCVKLRPDHLLARLRLSSTLNAMNDQAGGKKHLEMAENTNPESCEVVMTRGEWYFAQGRMDEAIKKFEHAMELDPTNPTPLVNCAMTIMNTPMTEPGQFPDMSKIMGMLEKALELDPQFVAAYTQLGQLKLGTSKDLVSANDVVELYDKALEHVRTEHEIKELCLMRILAVAQIDAAAMLKMETFNMD